MKKLGVRVWELATFNGETEAHCISTGERINVEDVPTVFVLESDYLSQLELVEEQKLLVQHILDTDSGLSENSRKILEELIK